MRAIRLSKVFHSASTFTVTLSRRERGYDFAHRGFFFRLSGDALNFACSGNSGENFLDAIVAQAARAGADRGAFDLRRDGARLD